ncbi:MAG: 50S ribosomal protein L30 [Chlorobi bacterium]|nr:50S ribosomal protein L30 [Chlorobiota bacterium]
MKKVLITKVRSTINRPKDQKRTMEALGLRKIGQSREHVLTPQIEGMIKKVKHLIKVEEI